MPYRQLTVFLFIHVMCPLIDAWLLCMDNTSSILSMFGLIYYSEKGQDPCHTVSSTPNCPSQKSKQLGILMPFSVLCHWILSFRCRDNLVSVRVGVSGKMTQKSVFINIRDRDRELTGTIVENSEKHTTKLFKGRSF